MFGPDEGEYVSRQYDTQLIESVAVRRRRLREAWLFGSARSRNTLDEGVTKLFASAAVAAVVCAGCVGYSFLQDQRGKNPGGPVAPSPSAPATSGPTAPIGTPTAGTSSNTPKPPTPSRS
ncbi:hypothetical protein EV644_110177 [Kribbella orskensis]|uniref:Uncharacterized protein n=1 Tax=Kribbella orskensis TaxID=2512216 RepID=A0ABY2BIM3_9ACTN|nr:hypothetical protein EV642_110199 [Kribbella sp. VKM Ac-2500]TCO19529.1 hypothetical protein EV644_110177 [Kribbella orskensis]